MDGSRAGPTPGCHARQQALYSARWRRGVPGGPNPAMEFPGSMGYGQYHIRSTQHWAVKYSPIRRSAARQGRAAWRHCARRLVPSAHAPPAGGAPLTTRSPYGLRNARDLDRDGVVVGVQAGQQLVDAGAVLPDQRALGLALVGLAKGSSARRAGPFSPASSPETPAPWTGRISSSSSPARCALPSWVAPGGSGRVVALEHAVDARQGGPDRCAARHLVLVLVGHQPNR